MAFIFLMLTLFCKYCLLYVGSWFKKLLMLNVV